MHVEKFFCRTLMGVRSRFGELCFVVHFREGGEGEGITGCTKFSQRRLLFDTGIDGYFMMPSKTGSP